MHVLRPRSRPHGANSGQAVDGEHGPLFGEGDDGGGGNGTLDAGRVPHRTPPHDAAETTGHAREHRRSTPPGNVGGTTSRGRRSIPSKPEAARLLRSREQRNRRLSAVDGGKTVVVLASVPRVAREERSSNKPPPPQRTLPQRTALVGSPSKEAVRVVPDQGVLPWPLGRRCW